MNQYRLEAFDSAPNTKTDIVISEQAWRPARSILAIANQKILEETNELVVEFENFEDIDECVGFGFSREACLKLANKIEEMLKNDPFVLCDYGMTTDIINEVTVYTYPARMCTAYFEDKENGTFYESLHSPNILGRKVRSWFRITEKEMNNIVKFFKTCGGFWMP